MDQPASQQEKPDRHADIDSVPASAFEDVVKLAAQLCGSKAAALAMLDADGHCYKSIVGADIAAAARSEVFRNHAIATPAQLMEVPDARLDPRFANSARGAGGPAIRFYAGMPLTTASGTTIGTLCVWDHNAGSLSPAQRSGLQSLARLTMNLIEARPGEGERQRVELMAPPPVAVWSSNFRVVILEVQNLESESARLGERALERSLQRLQQGLEASLRQDSPDTVDRVIGSGEIVALLHGDDTIAPMDNLLASVSVLVRESGLRILAGSAVSASPGDTLTQVFIRADEALTRVKERALPQISAQPPSDLPEPRPSRGDGLPRILKLCA